MSDTAQIIGVAAIMLLMANSYRVIWKWVDLSVKMCAETALLIISNWVLALLVGMVIF
ncbi:MAG: hypothetical protein K0Q87_5030 [Neobacillus sp.]|jgi:hypothetical protein|nr:hypothetical protein [Neobacillus sp.]